MVLVNSQNGKIHLHYNLIPNAKNRNVYDNQNIDGAPLPGNTLARSEAAPIHAIQDVNDAYDFSGDTYDFYLSTHNRDSLDGNGMTLISTVRDCTFECPMANAFWTGGGTTGQMVYGDGFAVDDVVGHELTHAVTELTSNLIYSYESGAINESFSDLWGEFVDLTNTGGNDTASVRWHMGEDIPSIGAIRDMKDPTIFGDPDKVTSANYHCNADDNGGGSHQ